MIKFDFEAQNDENRLFGGDSIMKRPSPRADSVLAFLRFKGWFLVEANENQYILAPPLENKAPDFRLQLPRWEKDPPYYSVMVDTLNEIARLYNWEPYALIRLLSKSPKELDRLIQKAFLREQKVLEAKVEDLAMAS